MLDTPEELLADALDHEGRYLLLTELVICGCGSPEGYVLPSGELTCAPCLGYEGLVEISDFARRRWERRQRLAEAQPDVPFRARARG